VGLVPSPSNNNFGKILINSYYDFFFHFLHNMPSAPHPKKNAKVFSSSSFKEQKIKNGMTKLANQEKLYLKKT